MPTFTPLGEFLEGEIKMWSGEFTFSGGVPSLPKFHNAVTLTDSGVGLVTFNCFVDNPKQVPFKSRLAGIHPTFLTPPGGAAEGGWSWTLDNDAMLTAGTFRLRINQQSWAAADPVQVVKMIWWTCGRAAV